MTATHHRSTLVDLARDGVGAILAAVLGRACEAFGAAGCEDDCPGCRPRGDVQ